MKINLEQIYKELQAWREERSITAKSQKDGYIVNAMKELGELAGALRDYEKFSATKQDAAKKQKAEHDIINAFCKPRNFNHFENHKHANIAQIVFCTFVVIFTIFYHD